MDEFFQKLNKAGVRYLLIGGQAMRLKGMPRFSMDWDLYIPPRDVDNFERLNKAVSDDIDDVVVPLGKQGQGFVQTHQTRWGVIQFHLLLPGVNDFSAAESRAVEITADNGTKIRSMSGADLLAAKEAANRPQDQLDILFLRELARIGKL